MTLTLVAPATSDQATGKRRPWWRRHLSIVIGGLLLALMVAVALAAPFLGTVDPAALSPIRRLRMPSEQYWFGTDALGRDVYSRVVYGARASLFVALTRASLENVIAAIAIAEIPRVTRLVRSIVLGLREQPFVEAAIAVGTSTPLILWRHILPNTFAPLIVQATYIAASAIITEAILSFIGAGLPPSIPTWGNIIAEGRAIFQVRPHLILIPAGFLSVTVLAINLLGDGMRDALDPRLARQL